MKLTFGNFSLELRQSDAHVTALTLEDQTLIDQIFTKLAEGGDVVMPLQQTFWSKRYGFVIDHFGIGWQLSSAE